MPQSQELKCYICGLIVSESQAKAHSSTSTHGAQKHKLEQDLDEIKKGEYAGDNSVIRRWTSSV